MKRKCPVAALYERRPRSANGAKNRRSHSTKERLRGNGQQTAATTVRATVRREYRAWRASLPTALERDTLLWPEAIAESVVAEASRYLQAELPANFPERLAAKAYHLYPRHRFFHKVLNRPGNRGRDNLYVYMRHWTCGWLKRERWALFKRLPWEYSLGRPLKTETGLVTL